MRGEKLVYMAIKAKRSLDLLSVGGRTRKANCVVSRPSPDTRTGRK